MRNIIDIMLGSVEDKKNNLREIDISNAKLKGSCEEKSSPIVGEKRSYAFI